MDSEILKAIILSCGEATNDVQTSEDYKKLCTSEKFVPTSNLMFNALSTSLTKLLSYKVSKEAYQRYSVRTHVINVLRDWCKVHETFDPIHAFTNGANTLTFTKRVISKYLTDEVLDNCDNPNAMVSLINALLCMLPQNPSFAVYVERLIITLSRLDSTDESEKLLFHVAHKYVDLGIQIETVEQIYISQRQKFIEEPLLVGFEMFCNLRMNTNNEEESRKIHSTDQLLEFCVKSSCVFQLAFNFLKELFIQLHYTSKVLNFIQSTLKLVTQYCENQSISITDLYPRNLHSYVMLLRIEPTYYTLSSKEHTLRVLRKLMLENRDDVLILLTHFPVWFESFSSFLAGNTNGSC